MAIKKQCAFCHAILFEDDDIVYCPECGAAHHRDCYKSLGHCARAQLHGTPEAETDYSEPEQEEPAAEQAPPFEAHTQESGSQPFAPDFAPFEYACGGVDPQGDIDGRSVTDVAAFVRINTRRYMPKFQQLSSRKSKTDWNWSAFIFSFAWLTYRKCHLQSFIAMLFTLFSYVMTVPLTAHIYNALAPYYKLTRQEIYDNYEVITESMLNAIQTATPVMWLLCLAGVLCVIAIHVFLGLRGDGIYMSHVLQKIDKINSSDASMNKLQLILASGGINPFLAYIVFNIMNVAFSYMVAFYMV